MTKTNWHYFDNLEDQSIALAQQVAKDINYFLKEKQQVSLCVPGGTTPILFLETLSLTDIDWSRVNVLLNDERWVPINDKQSNEAMLRRSLQKNNAKKVNILGFYSQQPITASIEKFNKEHRSVFPIDICVLGMGEDGHTASLFPNMDHLDAALNDKLPPQLISAQPPGKEQRVSLNLAAILSSKKCYVLIKGKQKQAVLMTALKTVSPQLPISYLLQKKSIHIFYSEP